MVITISCFFVIMVYASVRFFSLAYLHEKSTQQISEMVWTLEGSLLHEIETSKMLYGSVSDSLLICIMPFGDTIRYKFKQRIIIRNQGYRSDTFEVSCHELRFKFNDHFVESGFTDHMEFNIDYRQSHQLLEFDKTYAPEILSNYFNIVNQGPK